MAEASIRNLDIGTPPKSLVFWRLSHSAAGKATGAPHCGGWLLSLDAKAHYRSASVVISRVTRICLQWRRRPG